MNFPFATERALFPILSTQAQLSSCSQSALSQPVADAIARYMASWQHKGMDWGGWAEVLERAKAEFAQLIGAPVADIAVMSCVSDLASSFAHCLEFRPGKDGVVLGDSEFPSLGHVWLAQQTRGAQISFVPDAAPQDDPLQAYAQCIGDSTRVVSISHVTYSHAARLDIGAIAKLAHAHDALVVVDAYQSVGVLKIDVVRDDIDVLLCGAQKYLLGCPGIAFMYIRSELANTLRPAHTGWFGRTNPFAFDIRTLDYAQGARRFDTGTPPYINAAAAQAGMALLNLQDAALRESYLAHLSGLALQTADELGLRVASPTDPRRKGAHTAIFVDDAAAVERNMAREGFVVSARGPVIRIAPHFYNTAEEVVTAVRAVARHA